MYEIKFTVITNSITLYNLSITFKFPYCTVK